VQDPQAITPTIVQVVKDPPAQQISMIDVAVGAFGLTGAIMVAALAAGLIAGALIVWYRMRRPITLIEARGGEHNLFRT
jgi:hypothetical protein